MATTPDAAVLATRDGPILTLTLNRPGSSNALQPELVDALRLRLQEASRDESLNVVVLTGSGRSFCAGLDLKHVLNLAGREKRDYLRTVLDLFREVWHLPQPVVAAINGAAVAGGFDLSQFCDLRVASGDAVFAQTEILIELNAISAPLFHTIGLGAARELAYLGEKISAQEAHRIGLVNRVVPPETLPEAAKSLARTMASRSRASLVATKRLTREMLDQHVEDGLESAAESILNLMESPPHRARLREYVAGFSKSKKPSGPG